MFPAGDSRFAPDETHETYHTGGGRELFWRDELLGHGRQWPLSPRRGALRSGDVAALRHQRPPPHRYRFRSRGVRSGSFAEADARAFNGLLRSMGLKPGAPSRWPASNRGQGDVLAALRQGTWAALTHTVDVNGSSVHRTHMTENENPSPQELVDGPADAARREGPWWRPLRRAAQDRRRGGASSAGRSSARRSPVQSALCPMTVRSHSLHAYFLRGGKRGPRNRLQGGARPRRRLVLQPARGWQASLASRSSTWWHRSTSARTAVYHADAMPTVAPPENLPSEVELRRKYADKVPEAMRRQMLQPRPIELRPLEARHWDGQRPPRSGFAHVVPLGRLAARRSAHPPRGCWPMPAT